MTGLAQDDITRMRDQLFFDGPERNRGVNTSGDQVQIQATGPDPAPSLAALRRDLDAAGLNGLDVRVSLVPASYKPLPG